MIRMHQEHNTTNPPGQIINRPIRCKMGQPCTCSKGMCEDAPILHHDRPLTQEIELYLASIVKIKNTIRKEKE